MKCTRCKKGELVPSYIEGQFRAHTCSNCSGNWILIEDYVTWKEHNPQFTFDKNTICDADEAIEESKSAVICPVTGGIMRKMRLSNTTDQRIDYSTRVGGVWLDKGEWELLKSKGLAGSLNAVLTSYWQKNIRINSTKDNFTEIYKDKFGEADYNNIKTLREWLNSQPNKADLRAYLLADDPYSAEN